MKKAMCHIDFPHVLDMTAYGGMCILFSALSITQAQLQRLVIISHSFSKETRQFWLMVSNALLSQMMMKVSESDSTGHKSACFCSEPKFMLDARSLSQN